MPFKRRCFTPLSYRLSRPAKSTSEIPHSGSNIIVYHVEDLVSSLIDMTIMLSARHPGHDHAVETAETACESNDGRSLVTARVVDPLC